jgi:hypothetical protein
MAMIKNKASSSIPKTAPTEFPELIAPPPDLVNFRAAVAPALRKARNSSSEKGAIADVSADIYDKRASKPNQVSFG